MDGGLDGGGFSLRVCTKYYSISSMSGWCGIDDMYSTYLIACTPSLHGWDTRRIEMVPFSQAQAQDQGSRQIELSFTVLHSDHLILHHCFELLNNEL